MSRDIYTGAVLLLFAGLYWLGADAIRLSPLSGGGVGEQALPKLLAVSLAALSALMIVQTVLARRSGRGREARQAADAERPRRHLRAAGMLLIGAGYLLVVDVIGYVLALALLIGLVVTYNGRRLSREVALTVAAGSILFYLFFVQLLGIPLPAGVWPDLWTAAVG